MIHRVIAELNITPDQKGNVIPPVGIDVMWLETNPYMSVAEFVCSDIDPDMRNRYKQPQLRYYVQDNFKVIRFLDDHPNSPNKAKRIEALLDHPFFDDPTSTEIKRTKLKNIRNFQMDEEEYLAAKESINPEWGIRNIEAKSAEEIQAKKLWKMKNPDTRTNPHLPVLGMRANTPVKVYNFQIAEVDNEDTKDEMDLANKRGITAGTSARRNTMTT